MFRISKNAAVYPIYMPLTGVLELGSLSPPWVKAVAAAVVAFGRAED